MNSVVWLVAIFVSCFSCSVSGFFSNGNRRGCPEPNIKNGDHTPHAWFIWTHKALSTVTVTCNAGYRLADPKKNTARCKLNGKWDYMPSCVAPEGAKVAQRVLCPLPPLGDNVDVAPMKMTYDTDEIVTFACPGVRKADGYRTTVCGQDGQFSPPPPACIAPKCIPPVIPANGGLSPKQPSYAIGEVVAFKCAKGYKLKGANSTECGQDGYFPYTETSCEELSPPQTCSKPQVGENQMIYRNQDSYEEGEIVTFYCFSGYKLKGARTLECLENGEWSSKRVPSCKKTCKRPDIPANGRLINAWKRTYLVGETARFECNQQHQLIGKSRIRCQNDGQFHPDPPICLHNKYRFYH